MQRDLFSHSGFSITPEGGRREPRLWVRRLVIWREPGEIVRDVPLKPGLNVVWSPDPGTSDTAIGHGSGKTTFCRLLRYCLGEASFAPEGQRLLTWKAFPNGHVGAEILLAGRLWIVVRALGDRRRDIVIENGSFDDAFRDDVSPTGIDPLRIALTETIIGEAAPLIPSPIGEAGAWEAALAWATRDQECRFGKHVEWRDPDTDSRSPVRGRSEDDRVMIVRALIRALRSEEGAVRRTEQEEARNAGGYRDELTLLDRQIRRARASLVAKFGGGEEPGSGSGLDAAGFRAAAAARLADVLKLPAAARTTDLPRARAEHKSAAEALSKLTADLTGIDQTVGAMNKALAMLRAELPEAHARLVRERNPVCPICEVPIDKALAEGCGISTATCDVGALQVRIARSRSEVEQQEAEVATLEAKKPRLKAEIVLAQQRLESFERTVAALERSFDGRKVAVRAAQRVVRDAEDYDALLAERESTNRALEQTEARLTNLRDTLAAHRAAVAETIRHLSGLFDSVLKELVPGDIQGEVRLDGRGLTLKVELGGDRTTAAIESLKVVAFDLAVLAMTIEGRTNLPGFVVHDSPREADLQRSIYHRLFGFARRLEGFGPGPLFQYIVTTTTEPPEEFKVRPWMCLRIKGSPASERLLGVDL